MSPYPTTISETGLFAAPPDFAQRPERLHLFKPGMELWSDGLHKHRFVLLPEGQRIDNADPDHWVFPIGTILVKTFYDDGASGTILPVETRFVRRESETGFDYAVYVWNELGTEATLADNLIERVPAPAYLHTVGDFTHNVPSEEDCEDCHRENGRNTGSAFIGFDEWRLNAPLEPGDAMTQLERFAELGYFTSPLPLEPRSIMDPDPRLQQVQRFVFGNCVHCHHGGRVVDFRPDVFTENTLNAPPDSSGIEPPPGFLRIVPGAPEMSIVYVQAARANLPDGLKPMPPIAVQFPPESELENMRLWIESLPVEESDRPHAGWRIAPARARTSCALSP